MNTFQIEHAIEATHRLNRKLIEAVSLPINSSERRNRLASCQDNLETLVVAMERALIDQDEDTPAGRSYDTDVAMVAEVTVHHV
ncbi:hypothetical protein HGP16_25325 [Rhizobium sp. P40RR-XXII]|nr:hypothetical protein [Rhizobium sp. P40RR-XXII]